MAKRKSKAKNVCVPGMCPGPVKHLLSEAAAFGALYYTQVLLGVDANLWLSSLILLVLINVSLWWCPGLKDCCP